VARFSNNSLGLQGLVPEVRIRKKKINETGKNCVMIFMICTPRQLYPSNQINKDELRGAYGLSTEKFDGET
jgi:hypothetical protein